MNFFEQQDQARQKTWLLVALFAAAVACIIGLTIFLMAASVWGFEVWSASSVADESQFNWTVIVKTAVAVIAIVLCVIFFKRLQISQGGHAIADMLGGQPIEHGSDNLHEQRLLNVVEEMAIAAGLPVPPVYVLDETTINAFAAGFSESDAVIGVTRGTLERMSRDQLQGVIAHEFSHILHGDMRLNLNLITVLAGIIFIGQSGRFVMHGVSRVRGRNQGAIPVFAIGLGLIVIGSIGTLFGNIIKAAVSRQREFLADASAVQYTRNPDGIAGALKVIGGSKAGTSLATPRAEEFSHMFFGDAIFLRTFNFFSTHPPLDQRIRRIEPRWDGSFLPGKPLPEQPKATTTQSYQNKIDDLADSIRNTGILDPIMVAVAGALMHALPSPLHQATQQSGSAYALMLALRLDIDPQIREQQLAALTTVESMLAEVKRLAVHVKDIPQKDVLPVIEMSIPALKRQSADQYKQLKQHLTQFIMADQQSDYKEWLHFRLLSHYLDQHFAPRKKRKLRRNYHAYTQVKESSIVVLSLLANESHSGEQEAETAFASGMKILKMENTSRINQNELTLNNVNQALAQLEYLVPLLKEQFLVACAECIQSNNEVTVMGWDLLRVTAACLGCPMPIIDRPGD